MERVGPPETIDEDRRARRVECVYLADYPTIDVTAIFMDAQAYKMLVPGVRERAEGLMPFQTEKGEDHEVGAKAE